MHGYGEITFRFETDPQGEPMVHRVDGGHPDSYYLDNRLILCLTRLNQAFDLDANIYLIVIDNSVEELLKMRQVPDPRQGKNGGFALR